MRMTTKTNRHLVATGIFLLLAVMTLYGVTSTAVAADAPIMWRMQSVWGTTSLAQKLGEKFCDGVKAETNGRLEIKLYPPGGIVKATEVFDAVNNGAIQMGFSTGIYNAGKIPEALVEFGMPFSFSNAEQCYDFLYHYKDGEVMKIIRQAYRERNIHLIATGPSASYGYMTTFPAEKLSDFSGKKIRSFGFFGALVKMMGGAPVSIPAAEQYLALQRGTVDGTIFPYYSMDSYNFNEVAKYVIKPPVLATPTINFYVNAKTWDSLPDDLKTTVSQVAQKSLRWYSEEVSAEENVAMEKSMAKGVKIMTLPEAEVAKLQSYGEKIWAAIAKKSERTKDLIDMLKTYLSE